MSTLGESSNQGPGRPRRWCVLRIVGVLLFLAVTVWAGGRMGDKLDAVTKAVVDLRDEHHRLCRMYALFGPLEGDEEINPRTFPLCRRVYMPTIYIDGVPSGKTKE